jgi:hypothetical protein
MGRTAAYLLAVALGVTAAIALVACGKEDAQLLPGETAREIIANLDTVNQLANEGDCLGAESAADQVSEQIDALTGVDAKLKQALLDGATRLNEVVDECEEETTEAVSPRIVPTETEEIDKKEEKEREKEERGREKEEKKEAHAPTTPSEPPADAEEEGSEEGESEEPPSGGVGPGSPVGEEG